MAPESTQHSFKKRKWVVGYFTYMMGCFSLWFQEVLHPITDLVIEYLNLRLSHRTSNPPTGPWHVRGYASQPQIPLNTTPDWRSQWAQHGPWWDASKTSELFSGISNAGSAAFLWGSMVCHQQVLTSGPGTDLKCFFVRRRLSHVTLTLSQMLSPIRDGMRTSSGKEDWRSHPAKQGPWEPTPKLWVLLVLLVSSVHNHNPRPGLDPPQQRRVNAVIFPTRTANRDLLVSRWETPQLWGLPSPDLVRWHSCCKF